MKKLLLLTAGILLFAGPSFAQVEPPHPRSITVSGESREEVSPDQAVLSMSLVSKDKNISVAKQHNDALAERMVAIARKFDIPKEKIATSGLYIAPEYAYDPKDQQQHLTGYAVNRSVRITLDSMDVHEKLISALVDAGIDDINGLEFRLADPEKLAAPLRNKAFEDAKAKAQALAQAAGGKLGEVLNIWTVDEPSAFPPRPMPVNAMRAEAAQSVAPTLPGLIELHEAVNVTFTLE